MDMCIAFRIVPLVVCLCIGLALTTPASALMLVSRKQEVSMGKMVQEEVVTMYGGLSIDRKQTERVQRVGAAIAAVAPRKDVTFTYQVLNSSVVNAFSAPGGPVMITQRLARMLPTDDELAFVLAHETGHIVAQHARQMMNRSLISRGLGTILFGGASLDVQAGVNMVYTVYDRGYSRNMEYQADAYGVQLMRQAGYNPEGAIKALAKLGMEKSSGLNKYMATHPDVPRRIDRIRQIAGIQPTREQQLIKEATAEVDAK